ncbi:hypothetical protein LIER_13969 [Lithospermum erythrorhizon]|uniref:Uncharacterized protein n=1 Tax=Lithospermum erythrorhizon TaxID=34254 RepID=A0AAV3Q2L6_LITER
MFFTHPSRKLAKSLLLGEIYADLRKEERVEEERVEGDQEMEADNVEVQGVKGESSVRVERIDEANVDDFMKDNNIFFEDFDHDTKAFMRKDNFGEDYEYMEKAEMESETHEAYTEIEEGKALKDIMWKCARATNEPYFELKMQQLKSVTVDGYEALRLIDQRKWIRWAFRLGRNNPELVNNWAEAFNIFIIRARDQHIIRGA